MRYKLNADGYVVSVAFGCYLDGSAEYTGTVPIGYNTLDDWATYSCIQAYYIDINGNLALDQERLAECRRKEAQEKVDNEPLLRKDLYGSEEVLDSQYLKATEKGEVIILEDIKTITPRVKITGIKPYSYTSLVLCTQGKNMIPCDATSQTISDVVFTVNMSGSITVKGTATEDIEYLVCKDSLFSLKKGHDYYLNLGGLDCELRYHEGEATAQQYIGASGLLNLPESIKANTVAIKIPSGATVDTTFFPQLEYGNAFTSYEGYKCKMQEIDFTEYIPTLLVPSNTLYPSDNLYPSGMSVDYIRIEQGIVYICVYGVETIIGTGYVGLYGDYNTFYSSEDATVEIEYSTKVYDVDSLEFLQGKETTTKKFKILEDGSIEAKDGYFSGTVTASTIDGCEIISEDDSGGIVTIKNGIFKTGTTGANVNIANAGININQGSACVLRFLNDFGRACILSQNNKGIYIGTNINDVYMTFNEDGCGEILVNKKLTAYEVVIQNLKVLGTATFQSSPVISSDRELKKEIAELDLQKASDFIYSLKPCEFKYITGTSNRFHHGLIAQEVKESMGEDDWGVYVDSEETGEKGVRYEELVADLIATVQTQNKRIELLENKLKEIEA